MAKNLQYARVHCLGYELPAEVGYKNPLLLVLAHIKQNSIHFETYAQTPDISIQYVQYSTQQPTT